MMKPSVGRKVWYRPNRFDVIGAGGMAVAGPLVDGSPGPDVQPLDATVIAVWGDRMVNLLVIDIMGKAHPRLSVTLLQEGDTPTPGTSYAEWMPYQIGQAKQLENAAAIVGSVMYADGTKATGVLPLPAESPAA